MSTISDKKASMKNLRSLHGQDAYNFLNQLDYIGNELVPQSAASVLLKSFEADQSLMPVVLENLISWFIQNDRKPSANFFDNPNYNEEYKVLRRNAATSSRLLSQITEAYPADKYITAGACENLFKHIKKTDNKSNLSFLFPFLNSATKCGKLKQNDLIEFYKSHINQEPYNQYNNYKSEYMLGAAQLVSQDDKVVSDFDFLLSEYQDLQETPSAILIPLAIIAHQRDKDRRYVDELIDRSFNSQVSEDFNAVDTRLNAWSGLGRLLKVNPEIVKDEHVNRIIDFSKKKIKLVHNDIDPVYKDEARQHHQDLNLSIELLNKLAIAKPQLKEELQPIAQHMLGFARFAAEDVNLASVYNWGYHISKVKNFADTVGLPEEKRHIGIKQGYNETLGELTQVIAAHFNYELPADQTITNFLKKNIPK
jgi:hypothetical protein